MGVLLRVEKTASMQISRCWSQNQDLRAMQISQRRSARGGDRSEASDASNELSAKRAPPFAHSGSMTGDTELEIKNLLYCLRTMRSFFHNAITTSIWLLCAFSGSSLTARHSALVDQFCVLSPASLQR